MSKRSTYVPPVRVGEKKISNSTKEKKENATNETGAPSKEVVVPPPIRGVPNANISRVSAANQKVNTSISGVRVGARKTPAPTAFSKSTADRLSMPKVVGNKHAVSSSCQPLPVRKINKAVKEVKGAQGIKADKTDLKKEYTTESYESLTAAFLNESAAEDSSKPSTARRYAANTKDFRMKSGSNVSVKPSPIAHKPAMYNPRKLPGVANKPDLAEKTDVKKKPAVIDKSPIKQPLGSNLRKGSVLSGGRPMNITKKPTNLQIKDDNNTKSKQQTSCGVTRENSSLADERNLHEVKTATELKNEKVTIIGKTVKPSRTGLNNVARTKVRNTGNATFKSAEKNIRMKNTISADKIIKMGTKPPPRIITPPPGMSSCRYCFRNFIDDRIERHENICEKLANKRVKVYDSSQKRIEGLEEANSCETLLVEEPKPQKSNWRRKHEDFINVIRAAKAVTVHIAKGGKLSDLPQPPPSENPDYIQCPHCLRRFNERAASRHIPKCADMLHNKPKPPARRALNK